jgi:hypothetical protein
VGRGDLWCGRGVREGVRVSDSDCQLVFDLPSSGTVPPDACKLDFSGTVPAESDLLPMTSRTDPPTLKLPTTHPPTHPLTRTQAGRRQKAAEVVSKRGVSAGNGGGGGNGRKWFEIVCGAPAKGEERRDKETWERTTALTSQTDQSRKNLTHTTTDHTPSVDWSRGKRRRSLK